MGTRSLTDIIFHFFSIESAGKLLGSSKDYLGRKMEAFLLDPVGLWLEKLFGGKSPYRGLLMSLVTVLFLFVVYKIATKALKKYLESRDFKRETIVTFLMVWRYTCIFIIVLFAVISMSGSVKALGISAGFLGMMLGWSLQAPVTGIAAWLMIVLKRPFKIGERVIIGGIIGDVTDITLTHVVLNQVGGTVGGEERSGRGILIPNAIMFGQIIINYTFDAKYILDEVPVRITFESDWDEAENVLLNAAYQVTKEIIEETGIEPFIRAEFFDAGVLIRLRYNVTPPERQRVSTDITKIIFQEFAENGKVYFCYPHSNVIYEWKSNRLPPAHPEVAEAQKKLIHSL